MEWSPGAVFVESVTFSNVIDFQCYSPYFNTLSDKYKEVKYQLKQFFLHECQIWLFSEIDNDLQKGDFTFTMSA